MDITSVASAIEKYQEHASDTDIARLEFFKGVFQIQSERASLVADTGYEGPSEEEALELYRAEKPFFSAHPVSVDPQAYAETCRRIAAHFAQEAGLDEAVAEALTQYDWSAFVEKADLALAGSNPPGFVEACLVGLEELAVPSDLPAKVFAMVVALALRPHLEGAAAKAAAHMPSKRDPQSHGAPLACPVCGTPAAASLVQDSQGEGAGRERLQYCAACGTRWAFERIRCGVCGDRNTNKLQYVNAEGDRAHRILACEACGEYQRVVFQDEMTVRPLVMEVEDVVMAKLDQMALDPEFKKEIASLS